ncbi:MAG: EpsI family protein [Woeseiaceae bacterium]|nr:EpsI family protein [Woeseiaceae bacterium]
MFAIHLRHPAIQRFALIVGIGLFVVLAFGSSFTSMWALWQTSDHRHGILVFPISAFLIWQLRHEFAEVRLHVEARGLLLVAVAAAGWILARLAGIQVAEHVFAITLIPAAIWVFAGWQVLRKIFFPVLFLYFATPFGEALVPALMLVTADMSTALLEISGIPHFRDGQYISLPGGEFVVADVCAGLRYLSTGVMIALLYGHLTYERVGKQLLLAACTAVTLILANGLRAWIVMAVASATEMRYLGGRDHIYFGWLLFGIVMMLIMWVGARYADKGPSPDADPAGTIVARASHSVLPLVAALGLVMLAITVKPLQADFGETVAMLVVAAALLVFVYLMFRQDRRDLSGEEREVVVPVRIRAGQLLTAVAAVGILLLAPRFADTVERESAAQITQPDFAGASGCRPAGPWRAPYVPQFQNPAGIEAMNLDCSGHAVGVFTAFYDSALQGAELVSASNSVAPRQWDRFMSTSTIELPTGASVREIEISRRGYEVLIWYWYDVDGRASVGALRTKVNQLLALLQRKPAGGSVVILETGIADGSDAAQARLEEIASNIMQAQQRAAAGTP